MGKLVISQELSNKISNSLRIKQSDIDNGANKPIIRNVEPPKKDSPPRKPTPKDHSRQQSPKKSPIKKIPGKKIVPKAPKFNIMWLYAVIILGLFVVQYMFSGNNAKIINYQKFENEMLKPGDVEKLVAYKNGDLYNVDVYIKKDRYSPIKD